MHAESNWLNTINWIYYLLWNNCIELNWLRTIIFIHKILQWQLNDDILELSRIIISRANDPYFPLPSPQPHACTIACEHVPVSNRSTIQPMTIMCASEYMHIHREPFANPQLRCTHEITEGRRSNAVQTNDPWNIKIKTFIYDDGGDGSICTSQFFSFLRTCSFFFCSVQHW